ncbi:MAG: hypothetical protein OHK0021_03450 [Bryobacter sp.]
MSDLASRVPISAGAFQPLLAIFSRFAASRAAGPLLLALLIAFAFWRILFTGQYSWLNSYDLSSQVLPWLQFQAGEWKAGRFPAWSPYEWGGQNLIGQAQPGVVNPLYWLLYLAPLKRGWLREGALNWWFYGLHLLAGLNLYWLARSLGTTRFAAVAGGLIFALFGFMGAIDWPQMISGLVWAPLCFLFLLRGAEASRPTQALRDAALAGLFLGLAWLSGHHQVPIFVSLALGGTVLALRFWPGILTFLVAGCLGAPQILPALLYGRHARRWVGMEDTVGWKDPVAYYVHEQYANAPSSLLGLLLPGKDTHTGMFLGLTALALALLAIHRLWPQRSTKVFFGIGLAGLLYALGRLGLVEPLLYSLVPMVEKARSPSMAVSIFTLGFAVLAAKGFDLLHQDAADFRPLLARVHALFGGAVVALFTLSLLTPPGQNRLEERWMMAGFLSLLVAWAYSAKVKGKYLNATLLAVLLVESANYTYFNMGNRFDPQVAHLTKPMAAHLDLREYLASQPGPVRVTVDDKAIPYNFGDWHGVDVMGGYLASLSDNFHGIDVYGERSRQLLGIQFHLGHQAFQPDSPLVFTGQAGVHIYRYPAPALPRVRLVHRTLRYQRKEEYNALLANPALDLAQVALTREAIPALAECPEQAANEHATILLHESSRVVLRAQAACRALLLLADTDEAGWQVSIDGRPAPKHTVHEFLRATVLEPGLHTVEWTYRAPGLLPACGLAALAILGTLVLVWRARR